MSTKRQRTQCDTDIDYVEQTEISPAAKFNRVVLRKLQKALDSDPEIDLASLLPLQYSSRLAAKVVQGGDASNTLLGGDKADVFSEPQKTQPTQATTVKIVHPLSPEVTALLDLTNLEIQSSTQLPQRLSKLVESSTVIFQSTASDRYVAQCSQRLVVKVTELQQHSSSCRHDLTEYKAMRYLGQTKPDFVAPKLQGLLISGNVSYLFMTHIPGVTLESIWQQLTTIQRQSLTLELDRLLLELRQLPRLPEDPLGGVDEEGCKDMRRHIRYAEHALYTNEDFWQFLYGGAREADTVYCQFLRQLTWPPRSQEIVFTHGDIRPANIIVQERETGDYCIGGMIDWEMSGFYPSDYECIRATNNLSSVGKDDWYLYLPSCVSPREHFRSWISDWIWDPYVV